MLSCASRAGIKSAPVPVGSPVEAVERFERLAPGLPLVDLRVVFSARNARTVDRQVYPETLTCAIRHKQRFHGIVNTEESRMPPGFDVGLEDALPNLGVAKSCVH